MLKEMRFWIDEKTKEKLVEASIVSHVAPHEIVALALDDLLSRGPSVINDILHAKDVSVNDQIKANKEKRIL